jgi:hypothetical protein
MEKFLRIELDNALSCVQCFAQLTQYANEIEDESSLVYAMGKMITHVKEAARLTKDIKEQNYELNGHD